MQDTTNIHPEAIRRVRELLDCTLAGQVRRFERGLELARSGAVNWQQDSPIAIVKSASSSSEYMVDMKRLSCGCEDAAQERHFAETYSVAPIICKHVIAAMLVRENITYRMATPIPQQ